MGERPIGDPMHYVVSVVLVFCVWFVLWLVFRFLTFSLVTLSDEWFAFFSIIAAPTITLIPPYIWWRYYRRERGLPYLLTRRNLFSSVALAALAALLFWAVMTLTEYPLLRIIGVEPQGDVQFVAAWRGESFAWLLEMSFLYMIIVGPVEELFNRGFLQDQVNRAYKPWVGISLAGVLFVLGHVPVDFLVYGISLPEWGVRWLSSFPFAVAIGVYYHWSRNIWGAAVYHGLYDWYLSIAYINYTLGVSISTAQSYVLIGVWSLFEVVIIVGLGYMGYRLWWRDSRPADSLGLGLTGDSVVRRLGALPVRLYAFAASRPLTRMATRIERSRWPGPQVWSLLVIGVVMMGSLGLSGAIGVVPASEGGGGGGGGGGGSGHETYNYSYSFSDYLAEGSSGDYSAGEADELTVVAVRALLMWRDEPAVGPRFTNQPDTFRLELALSDGTPLDTEEDASGQLSASWMADEPVKVLDVVATVTAVTCGDQVPLVSPGGLRDRADDGNEFALNIEIEALVD